MNRKSGISPLGYVLLALLARGPKSGYDLAQILKGPATLLWKARHSQIYPELAKLEEAGLAAHERQQQESKPDRKAFKITEVGIEVLRDWALTPPEPWTSKSDLVVKAHLLWMADTAGFIEMCAAEAARIDADLAALKLRWEDFATRRPDDGLPPHRSKHFATRSIYRYAEAQLKARKDWLEWLMDELTGSAQTQSGTESSPIRSS
ncbi:MAG: hypothetical protein Rhirs2KO_30080 [Rhizobiaceae bacterium]